MWWKPYLTSYYTFSLSVFTYKAGGTNFSLSLSLSLLCFSMAFHHRKLLFEPSEGEDQPPPPPSLHISPILLLMICVLGASVLVVCYHVILNKYRSSLNNFRRRNLPSLDDTREEIVDENNGPVVDHPIWFIHTVGLQQSLIDSITVFKYKRDEEIIEGTECSVCLNGFQEDESLRLLPKCSHAFHTPCIDTWLRSHKNCPLCRAPIVCENAPVSTVEPNLNDMGFQPETHGGLGEGGTSELTPSRVGGENNGSLPIEEGKIADILERNCGVRVKSDLGDRSATVEVELQQVRRSISMDSFPVGNEGCLNTRIVQAKKPSSEVVGKRSNRKSSIYRVMMKSCSFGPSLHKGPVHMKRSFSSSGKCSKPRYSRSHDSILSF